ncbi:AP-3 complex subunit beta [Blastocladiella emersonii ATCC 22665]|nr:AP-3 complex subunit beta [Blastocladiella emersonii ATCC 22665]
MTSLFSRAATVVQTAARLSADVMERAKDSLPGVTHAITARTAPGTSAERIETLLDSRFDVEKLEGLRAVLQLMSQPPAAAPASSSSSPDADAASHYFAHVVKNAVNANPELRRHVYAYVAVYATAHPDLALLCINALQRDLADPNPATRALALRTLAAIHLGPVVPVVSAALLTASKDISPLVRKTAALAVARVAPAIDPDNVADLLDAFLNDREPGVAGAAVQALVAIDPRPESLACLHPHYRRLCDLVVGMDHVAQAATLNALLKYARAFLPPPAALMLGATAPAKGKTKVGAAVAADPDLELLWQAAAALRGSSHAPVLYAAATILSTTATPEYRGDLVDALVLLVAAHPVAQLPALHLALAYAQSYPSDLRPHLSLFRISGADAEPVRALKLRVQVALLSDATAPTVLGDLRHAIYAAESPAAAALLVQLAKRAEWRDRVFPHVLELLTHPNPLLVAQAIVAVKYLFATTSGAAVLAELDTMRARVLTELVRVLPDCTHAAAKATLLYLCGLHLATSPLVRRLLPDLLRITALSFNADADAVKFTALALAGKAKAATHPDPRVAQLAEYILALGRAAAAVEVREKTRLLDAVLDPARPHVDGVRPIDLILGPHALTAATKKSSSTTASSSTARGPLDPALGPWTPIIATDAHVRDPPPAPAAPTVAQPRARSPSPATAAGYRVPLPRSRSVSPVRPALVPGALSAAASSHHYVVNESREEAANREARAARQAQLEAFLGGDSDEEDEDGVEGSEEEVSGADLIEDLLMQAGFDDDDDDDEEEEEVADEVDVAAESGSPAAVAAGEPAGADGFLLTLPAENVWK